MKIKNDESLQFLTTMKIGGVAEKMYFPESDDDIKTIFEMINKNEEIRIISGGSNLLINDKKSFPHVINMKLYENKMEQIEDNRFYISASCRIQNVINYVNSKRIWWL